MRRNVTFAPCADADVDEVYAWTCKHFGLIQAEKYLELIWLSVEEIALHPDSPLARRHPGIHPDARIMHLSRKGHAASHFLLFRLLDDGNIEIGRLLHDSRDWPEHLPEEYQP